MGRIRLAPRIVNPLRGHSAGITEEPETLETVSAFTTLVLASMVAIAGSLSCSLAVAALVPNETLQAQIADSLNNQPGWTEGAVARLSSEVAAYLGEKSPPLSEFQQKAIVEALRDPLPSVQVVGETTHPLEIAQSRFKLYHLIDSYLAFGDASPEDKSRFFDQIQSIICPV